MLRWEENELLNGLHSAARADYESRESELFSSGRFTAVVYYLALLLPFQSFV